MVHVYSDVQFILDVLAGRVVGFNHDFLLEDDHFESFKTGQGAMVNLLFRVWEEARCEMRREVVGE